MRPLIRVAQLLVLFLAQSAGHALIDVPFMPQTPALCGGAAVSMVLRYWGQRDVFPQDFAPLVSAADGGIFTSALAGAVRERGWNALAGPASPGGGRAELGAEIDRGRPIVALIEAAPRVYHYVVIVGLTERDVVFHDPARAPFRVLEWAEFDRAWAAANRWMMLVLPPDGFVKTPDPAGGATPLTDEARPARTPCTPMVEHAIEAALAGRAVEAGQELLAATRLCPADPAAWREMAGLRFSERRWHEADQLATTAARLLPADPYAWQLAGTSRYLMGDTTRALGAWNRAGEPKIDVVNIQGAIRMRLPVVMRAAALEPRELLTAERLTRALRRLRDLPAAAGADVKYSPVAGGLANVEVVISERPSWPRGIPAVVMLGVRAATQRELRVDAAGFLGEGEAATAAWRFARNRPRVLVGLSFPSPRWLPGITAFTGMWERQSYATASPDSAAPFRETRRRAGLQWSDWPASWLTWRAGGALDEFNDTGYAAADASLGVRAAADRISIAVSGAAWVPFGTGSHFATGSARAAWQSTTEISRAALSSSIDYQRASADAPLAVWFGAGTGSGRPGLLRAHRLLDHGVMTGATLGRELVNSTIEFSKPVSTIRLAVLSAAGFVDVARASRRRDDLGPSPIYVDAGVGLRLRLPGRSGGVRVDLAHGLRGGGFAISAGWLGNWMR